MYQRFSSAVGGSWRIDSLVPNYRICLYWICAAAAAHASVLLAQPQLPVEYRWDATDANTLRPSVRRLPGDLEELAPGRSDGPMLDQFVYRYQLFRSANSSPPLCLRYSQLDEGTSFGLGWDLVLANGRVQERLGIASPKIHCRLGERSFVFWDGYAIPIKPCRNQEHEARRDTKDAAAPPRFEGIFAPLNATLQFALREGRITLSSIQLDDGTLVRCDYRRGNHGNEPRIDGLLIVTGSETREFRFYYSDQGVVRRIERRSDASCLKPDVVWEFGYDTTASGSPSAECLLRSIARTGQGRGEPLLEFRYKRASTEASAVEGQPPESVWRQETSIPWRLPDGVGFKSHAGLRFTKLNNDELPDLVDTQTVGRVHAWLATKRGTWQPFGAYRVPEPFLTRNLLPRGSQFSDLSKSYVDHPNKNTRAYQSILTSYYRPISDTQCEYVTEVAFPSIDDRPQNGGNLFIDPTTGRMPWDVDSRPLLRLPMPLQFRSQFSRWPVNQTEHAPVESMHAQGAQFVATRKGTLLFFAGNAYEDLSTPGQFLSVSHRQENTENRMHRYSTSWGSRRVQVSLFQGVWRRVARGVSDQEQSRPLWERVDISDGKPNGMYSLPWPDDPCALYHYEGFRNVRFARLRRRGDVFAVLYGEERAGPAHSATVHIKTIYRFTRNATWEKLEPSDPLTPPDDFFRGPHSRGAFFIDLNGDRADDIVLPWHPDGKVYLNTPGGWIDAPQYYLPSICRGMSRCKFVELDSFLGSPSRGIDLIAELRGRTIVFMNRGPHVKDSVMTHFTDESGELRKVK